MARGRRTTAVAHNSGAKLEEAVGLAEAIGLDVVSALIVPIPNPKAGTLFGSGKQDQLADMVQDLDIELVIIDHAVTPVQQRNLEKAWQAKVMDRTGLILEIFGARARTREGRLQVELAHLSYQNGRLVRAWTHLERQRGGGGFLGGPGEAQIELDRRMLQSRIDAIRKELQQVIQTRELHRAGRRKVPYPIVALVGYTNAGKSTLFNALTGADVHAEDQVFATLDPTMREVRLPSGRKIILSDTVGFISELPTTLVAAFKATLEEVIEADLILHVRDIAHDETDAQAADVISILEELDVDTSAGSELIIEAWNKIDLLDEARRNERSLAASKLEGNAAPAILSATTGEGIPALLDRIDARLGRSDVYAYVTVPAGDGKLWHWLHEHADIIDREELETGDSRFQVRMASDTRGRLESQFNVTLSDARPAA
ncbi:MAG: GTPase HflX [Pseudomonadota bacterium]